MNHWESQKTVAISFMADRTGSDFFGTRSPREAQYFDCSSTSDMYQCSMVLGTVTNDAETSRYCAGTLTKTSLKQSYGFVCCLEWANQALIAPPAFSCPKMFCRICHTKSFIMPTDPDLLYTFNWSTASSRSWTFATLPWMAVVFGVPGSVSSNSNVRPRWHSLH